MTTFTQRPAGAVLPWTTPRPQGEDGPHSPTPPGWGRWLLLAAGVGFAGYLLFCHGCHGDEDNELWARWVELQP